MKKLFYTIQVAAFAALLTGCQQKEYETWQSATYNYDGRYTFGVDTAGVQMLSLASTNTLQIYNSAENTADRLWIEVTGGWSAYSFKGKFSITGSPASFNAPETKNANSRNYKIFIDAATGFIPFTSVFKSVIPLPTAEGEEREGIKEYTSVKLDEARITPLSETSIGGNTVDGFYAKVTMWSSTMKFVGRQTNPALWQDSDVPEFEWVPKENSEQKDAATEESFVLKGYRYTGYPEDK